ncbi:hypothetical protein [Rosistilla oblonga]|uniref:Uncharacterized protein n=1 Tax=Rosistilla oblonga TaxID=2527990 RepID=A0A518ITT6_9BACT|nr:hypothetical protein [Rosistilla oblonga]QDV56498.1 hypothetical protein Mal33_24890 [Rosistilla oblonga]
MSPNQQLIAAVVVGLIVLLAIAVVVVLVIRRNRKRCGCAPGCETPTPFTSLRNVRPTSNSFAVDCEEAQAYIDMRAEAKARQHKLAVARSMRELADAQLAEEDAAEVE